MWGLGRTSAVVFVAALMQRALCSGLLQRSPLSLRRSLGTRAHTRAPRLGVSMGYSLTPRPAQEQQQPMAPLPFSIRVATTSDIPSIRNCNLETLPENYSDDFYRRHLATWPRLAIVAEREGRLIGYTLGRVDTQPSLRVQSASAAAEVGTYAAPQSVGHVASIAVYPQYRKMGVARALMEKLHEQMAFDAEVEEEGEEEGAENGTVQVTRDRGQGGADYGPVDTVSLHCRVSNSQAIRLYSGFFPYACVSVVPKYYQDGEDAWFMRLTGLVELVAAKRKARITAAAAAAANSATAGQGVSQGVQVQRVGAGPA